MSIMLGNLSVSQIEKDKSSECKCQLQFSLQGGN